MHGAFGTLGLVENKAAGKRAACFLPMIIKLRCIHVLLLELKAGFVGI